MQAVTQKMAEFVQVFSTLPSSCQMVPAGVAHTPGASSGKTSLLANAGLAAASVPPTSVYLAHLPLPAALPGDPKGTPLTQQPHMSSPSGEGGSPSADRAVPFAPRRAVPFCCWGVG